MPLARLIEMVLILALLGRPFPPGMDGSGAEDTNMYPFTIAIIIAYKR